MSSPPPELVPAYRSGSASAPVDLWTGPLHFVTGVGRFRGDGRVFVRWRPRPEIAHAADVKYFPVSVLRSLPDEGRIVLWGSGASARGFMDNWNVRMSTTFAADVQGFLTEPLQIGKRVGLVDVRFHLTNFPNYIGYPVSTPTGWRAARVEAAWAPDWKVTIDSVAEADRLTKELRVDGGYAITHTGRLTKQSGRFSASDADAQLIALGHALSFVRGGMSYPILLVGRDSAGADVWWQWTTRILSSSVFRLSWFDKQKVDSLSLLIPGFVSRLADATWAEPLRRAVLLYVEANRTSRIEVQTALAQAALELLAWAMIVLDQKAARPKDFVDWSAGKRIRALLNAALLPTATPRELAALAAMAGPPATAEGPERIAYARNRFLHPPKSAPSWPSSSAAGEAALLAMLYVEQTIFYLSGYRGQYWNRVTRSIATFP